MGKVVYLLGAGASAGCLPVVNAMAVDINNTISEIDNYRIKLERENNSFNQNNDIGTINTIISDLGYLYAGCRAYSSVDTFAKKLFLTDKDNFERLKIVMSFYFTYKQLKNPPDLRYDNFWASILNSPNELPGNIRIISWNYDFQLEQSFINMTNSEDLKTSAQKINLYSHGCDTKMAVNQFGLIKINGSAQFVDSHTNVASYMCSRPQYFNSNLQEIINNYKIIKESGRYRCALKFGWEQGNDDVLFSGLSEMLEDVSALAIIGYSFPFFNRHIDSKIFEALPTDTKVYIQDKNPNAMSQRVQQVMFHGHEIVLIDDLAQFVFPMEL